MSLSRLGLILVASALAAACDTGPSGPDALAGHNVVLISIDSLRADHVGAYGYDRPTTPALDALAADSVVFANAYASSSFPQQSIAGILTGRLPTSGGSVGLIEAQPSESAETLGRLFRASDVRTGFVTNQHWLSARGFTRGFEDIQVSPSDNVWSAPEVATRALRFIDDYAPSRFFLFAHFLEPHEPYVPPAATASRFGASDTSVSVAGLIEQIDAGAAITADDARIAQLTARYDAEIAAVDDAIASLLAGLEQRGLADNTVVIITASQGQEFVEHGYLGHAWTVHEEVLRVPLIVHAPGVLAPQRVDELVSTIDLYPSLAALFGLDPGAWQPDGTSFIRAAVNEWAVRPLPVHKLFELVIRERCILRGVVADGWKYVAEQVPCPLAERGEIRSSYIDRISAASAGEIEPPPLWGEPVNEYLFRLDDDPGETTNLAHDEPEQAAAMRSLLEDYQRYCEAYALKATEPRIQELTDPEAADSLRALGYL